MKKSAKNIIKKLESMGIPTVLDSLKQKSSIDLYRDELLELYSYISKERIEETSVYTYMGNAMFLLNDISTANRLYDDALKLMPKNTAALVGKAVILGEQGKFNEALLLIQNALEYSNELIPAYHIKGALLNLLGRYEESIECYNEILRINKDDKIALTSKAIALCQLERFNEALETCNLAIQLDPSSASAWSTKGDILRGLGRYDEAANCEMKAEELDKRGKLESCK
ncbi:MAG: tetratricopeptide repeat protein [Candidatus Thermoplasmatota archaeon]